MNGDDGDAPPPVLPGAVALPFAGTTRAPSAGGGTSQSSGSSSSSSKSWSDYKKDIPGDSLARVVLEKGTTQRGDTDAALVRIAQHFDGVGARVHADNYDPVVQYNVETTTPEPRKTCYLACNQQGLAMVVHGVRPCSVPIVEDNSRVSSAGTRVVALAGDKSRYQGPALYRTACPVAEQRTQLFALATPPPNDSAPPAPIHQSDELYVVDDDDGMLCPPSWDDLVAEMKASMVFRVPMVEAGNANNNNWPVVPKLLPLPPELAAILMRHQLWTTRQLVLFLDPLRRSLPPNLLKRWALLFDWVRLFGSTSSSDASMCCAVQTDWTLMHTTHAGAIQEWYEAHMEEKFSSVMLGNADAVAQAAITGYQVAQAGLSKSSIGTFEIDTDDDEFQNEHAAPPVTSLGRSLCQHCRLFCLLLAGVALLAVVAGGVAQQQNPEFANDILDRFRSSVNGGQQQLGGKDGKTTGQNKKHKEHKKRRPLHVYILAGQDNMAGFGSSWHMKELLEEQGPNSRFAHLYDSKLKRWTVRDHVYVTNAQSGPLGKLTMGQGYNATLMGPELGFGWVLSKAMPTVDILLIKTTYNDRSLHTCFRPPSAPIGNYTNFRHEPVPKFRYGECYRKMIQTIDATLHNLTNVIPDYLYEELEEEEIHKENKHKKKPAYQIKGFVWYQGWSDRGPIPLSEYGSLLAWLLRDVRSHLKMPKLPIVVGGSGQIPRKQKDQDRMMELNRAQQGVTLLPDFAKTSAYISTKRFFNVSDTREYGVQYHYMGHADTIYDAGAAFGNAMLNLLRRKDRI